MSAFNSDLSSKFATEAETVAWQYVQRYAAVLRRLAGEVGDDPHHTPCKSCEASALRALSTLHADPIVPAFVLEPPGR